MRRRLYFLLPDVASARHTVDDLLLARVEDRHMHVLARRDTDLGNLHEAAAASRSCTAPRSASSAGSADFCSVSSSC
jgi:hypothetical protein